MKILLLGDYCNIHRALSKELRRRGHEVTLISESADENESGTDITLKKEKGMKGSFSYLFKLFSLLPSLAGYDVVQTAGVNFLQLGPGKIKYFLDRIKRQNKSLFLVLTGDDYVYTKACHDAGLFRFSEFKIGKEPTEFIRENPHKMYIPMKEPARRWTDYLMKETDGVFSLKPEHDMALRPRLGERLMFTGFPIDISELQPDPFIPGEKLKVLVPLNEGEELRKGTKYLLTLLKELERENAGKIEVGCVRNLTHGELIDKIKESGIVIDRLYGYSPGYMGLLAQALGRVTASGAQPEYYNYIREENLRPIIMLSTPGEEIKDKFLSLIENPSQLINMSAEARNLIEKHHDISKITDKFLNHWVNL